MGNSGAKVSLGFFNCNIVKSHRLDFEHHFSDVFPASH